MSASSYSASSCGHFEAPVHEIGCLWGTLPPSCSFPTEEKMTYFPTGRHTPACLFEVTFLGVGLGEASSLGGQGLGLIFTGKTALVLEVSV